MKLKLSYILAIGVIFILALGVMAARIGNVSIRRVQPDEEVKIAVTQPVTVGVNTTLRWDAPAEDDIRSVEIRLRANNDRRVLGTAKLSDGSADVIFPCDVKNLSGTLSFINTENQTLLAWIVVELLPPGPDCLQ